MIEGKNVTVRLPDDILNAVQDVISERRGESSRQSVIREMLASALANRSRGVDPPMQRFYESLTPEQREQIDGAVLDFLRDPGHRRDEALATDLLHRIRTADIYRKDTP
jgi:hypothetical protein